MIVTIDNPTFDRVDYDAVADVLYIHKGDPSTAVDFNSTPDGHTLRFDAAGELVGVTLVCPRRFLDSDGKLEIVLPLTSTLTPLGVTERACPPSLPLDFAAGTTT
jgi:uncharacterized protein YuzE